MSRRLYLVRHGETAGQSSIRYHGATDVPLSDEGRMQVEKLRPLVRDLEISALVHSPLSRAVESASILQSALGRPPAIVESDEDLREVNFGAIEGMTAEEIEAAMPEWYRAWSDGEVDGYPDGDRIDEFRARVARAVLGVVERHPAGDILLVAHKGIVKIAISTLCGVSAAEIRSWDIDLGSLWVLRAMEPWTLERKNVVG